MLHALEDEPEDKGRWGRLGVGSLIAVMIAGGALYGAQSYAPTRKLLNRVVQMTIQAPLPEKNNEPPPPPLPAPPPPKVRPNQPKKDPGPKQLVKAEPNPQAANPQEVGMDANSFGGGGDGPGFRVGGNQMGDPAAFVPVEKARAAAPVLGRPRLTFARALRQDPPPMFSERARKLGIEGLLIFELDIDELGHVKGARVRKGLEPKVDQEMLGLVKRWTFQPAQRAGRPVAMTQLFRYRYRFER
jgi:TonB family protein